jgi:hypothetical protein
MTLQQSYDHLKKDGTWSDAKELELQGLYKDIKELQEKLGKFQFHKAQQREIKRMLKAGKDRIASLEETKNQLRSTTIEHFANGAKQHFIVKNIVEGVPVELMTSPSFLDTLVVYYYKENSISEAQIRELARTDPWRLYWTVSKDTGTPLFPHSIVEMTDLQYALLLWSRIYDFAYESTNRPGDEVIKDNDKFDAWYRDECNRIEAEIRKNAAERALPGNGFGGQEVFIPADSEGAREVYQLNDLNARNRIAQRQKALDQNGSLLEAQLPDVARDLKMEVNRLASQGAMNRSK